MYRGAFLVRVTSHSPLICYVDYPSIVGPLALRPFFPYLVPVPECSPLLDTPLVLYPNSSLCILPLVHVPPPRLNFSPKPSSRWSLALPPPHLLPVFNPWTLCYQHSLSLDPFTLRINLICGTPYKEPLRLLCLWHCLLYCLCLCAFTRIECCARAQELSVLCPKRTPCGTLKDRLRCLSI